MIKKDILRKLYSITMSSLNKPYFGLSKKLFEQRCYQEWAVKEVLRAIETSDLPPYMVAEEFAEKMDEYACLKERTSFMFSVAHDTAEWIIEILLSMK